MRTIRPAGQDLLPQVTEVMPFQLSGDTNSVALPNVLQMLQYAAITGTLSVRLGSIEKSVHFKNGHIVFATSNDVQDRLGEVLVKAGFLTREDLEKGLVLFQKQRLKKIGAILVENGYVSPKDLYLGLKMQVKDIIYSLFLWDVAEYRFAEQVPPDVIELQFNLQDLIAEIIARIKREA
ncbi:MAG: hypothetical protein A2078_09265 [Nitrospirae bacterium GWC2_57_9]|nr:MAG: hypothetical protein A2078_09265 [Nitrospirae bacterium GWC2_57_9]